MVYIRGFFLIGYISLLEVFSFSLPSPKKQQIATIIVRKQAPFNRRALLSLVNKAYVHAL